MDGIGRIDAQAIRANIAANSSGSGAIGRVRSTVGGLIGSVAASALTSSTVGDGILVAGNLEAAINIPGSLSAPIRVGGNVQNGGSLTGGALQNANDAEIDIAGALNGNLSVGAVSRRVRVQGGVPSGSSLTTGAISNVSNSSLVISGGVAGSVTVNGAVGAPSSIAGGLSGSVTTGNITAPFTISGTVSGTLAAAILASTLTFNQPVTGTVTLGTVNSAGSVGLAGIAAAGLVTVNGNCSGPVNSGAPIVGRLNIGNSLLGTLSLPAGGLVGQVLINASLGSGTWQDPALAFIGGIALNNPPKSTLPAYRHPSMSYGNGAIALVPFRLYGDDCMPMVSGSGIGSLRVTPLTDGSEPAVIAFYGPITSSAAIGSSLVITRDDSADVTSQFTAALASVHGSDARAIRITANSGAGVQVNRDYTVTPVFDSGVPRIRSNLGLGAGNPGVVTQVGGSPTPGFSFTFRVVNDCFDPRADFNDDDTVDPDDLGDFINCYFSEVGTPDSCPAADFNDDDTVDPDDLGDFINVYFCNA